MTTHPSQRQGFLSSVSPSRKSRAGACVPLAFGRESGLSLDDLTDGLALVGCEDERRRVVASLMRDAVVAGVDYVVVSLGRSPALCDHAHALATEAGTAGTTRIVDAEASPERTHVLDPFADIDAVGLARVVTCCSPSLGGSDPASGKARALLATYAKAYVAMRDEVTVDLSGDLLASHLSLRHVVQHASREAYPTHSPEVRSAVRAYLETLPGYAEEKLFRQPQSAFEAHATVQAHLLDALNWMDADRYAAILGCSEADMTLADIGCGKSAVFHAVRRHGEDRAVSFLVACLSEALRMREAKTPLLVVVDGVHDLPAWQVSEIAGLRGEGVRLVVGSGGHLAAATAAALSEMGMGAALRGSHPDVVSLLGMGAAADFERETATLAGPDGVRQVAMPASVDAKPRESVAHARRSTRKALPEDQDAGVMSSLLSKLIDPGFPESLARAAADVAEDPVILVAAEAFLRAAPGAAGSKVAACSAIAQVGATLERA